MGWGVLVRSGLPYSACLLIALLLSASVPGPVSASELERQRQEAEEELQGLEGDLDEALDELSEIEQRHAATQEELAEVEARIERIEQRIAELQEELAGAKEELQVAEQVLAATEDELERTGEELDDARIELAGQRELFGDRVRGAFKRSNLSLAGAVLEAKDINEATRAAGYVQAFMARDLEQIETISALEAQIEQSVARLGELRDRRDAERLAAEEERDRIAGLVEEQEELQAEADAEADERRVMLATLEEEEERYQELVASLESESAALETQLAEIAAEERRREEQRRAEQQREEERRQAAAADRSRSGGDTGSSGSGQLERPVSGPVTSGFGYRTHPITGGRRLHAGIDYGAPTGTPIRAAESGTVVTAGGMGGYGVTVVINHGGGMSTLYAHQSSLAVSSGQSVSRGEVIGYVGSTGMSTGPHLHFEVRINGTPVNPNSYL